MRGDAFSAVEASAEESAYFIFTFRAALGFCCQQNTISIYAGGLSRSKRLLVGRTIWTSCEISVALCFYLLAAAAESRLIPSDASTKPSQLYSTTATHGDTIPEPNRTLVSWHFLVATPDWFLRTSYEWYSPPVFAQKDKGRSQRSLHTATQG